MATRHLNPALFDNAGDAFRVATPLSDALLICDRDPELTELAACCVTFESDQSVYVAPLFARSWVGNYYVIGVGNSPIPPFVRDVCLDIGWHATSVVVPARIELLNLRRLECDRYGWVSYGCESTLERLLDVASLGLMSIGALCLRVDERHPEHVEPLVNYALWHRLLSADWTRPITLQTRVTLSPAVDALYERVRPEANG
ncbi:MULTISPECIES: hypothetical protein [Gordonia]|uniref:hypothetical protein n=1 Tax=Gordonia TaxID=2053 RepID=UPI0007EA1305|nr:hypothetical protein [Gordonia sp. 852002-51296_SCH5728562-b]OBA42024.1 hypothetical protein A5766_19950 [Gordonia sp. 852002-51296_SCH5728562-b]